MKSLTFSVLAMVLIAAALTAIPKKAHASNDLCPPCSYGGIVLKK